MECVACHVRRARVCGRTTKEGKKSTKHRRGKEEAIGRKARSSREELRARKEEKGKLTRAKGRGEENRLTLGWAGEKARERERATTWNITE